MRRDAHDLRLGRAGARFGLWNLAGSGLLGRCGWSIRYPHPRGRRRCSIMAKLPASRRKLDRGRRGRLHGQPGIAWWQRVEDRRAAIDRYAAGEADGRRSVRRPSTAWGQVRERRPVDSWVRHGGEGGLRARPPARHRTARWYTAYRRACGRGGTGLPGLGRGRQIARDHDGHCQENRPIERLHRRSDGAVPGPSMPRRNCIIGRPSGAAPRPSFRRDGAANLAGTNPS